MPRIVAAVATRRTDADLRRRYNAMGAAAHKAGAARQCRMDPRSMIAAFWFEGWDAEHARHEPPRPREPQPEPIA